MRLDRRQLVIGAAVVVVLGLAAWMLSRPAPPPRAAAPAQTRARAGRPGADVVVGPADPVKLAALKTSHDDPGQAGRNPFRFQPKPAPPPIKVAPKPVESETPRPTGPPTPTGPPPPAPIALKFVGVLERANGVKWAVLTDGKSAPMYGKDGDIIDGKYLIVKIGAESVEMTHVDGRGRQVIRLTGQ